ncbi:hypothetical protein CYMTET_51944 [Cymbomonas tetramitiformis]|uniref:Uncharacterized protein n=1 Tax=Cymbomonas tetramitiformis TaxID=36881 RepID=A0AAE0BK76_9CHLO|nr:hypothetical protein CYMTET_51944 [Cymbomonas tetramitiformis]
MSSLRQRARMGAIRSTLRLLRQREFPTGFGMVVFGGAYAPDTKHASDNSAFDNKHFDTNDFIPPLPSPSPYAPPSHHLVVSGGVVAPTSPFTIIPLEPFPMRSTASLHRIFRRPPPTATHIIALALVVPGRFWLWHRTGIG